MVSNYVASGSDFLFSCQKVWRNIQFCRTWNLDALCVRCCVRDSCLWTPRYDVGVASLGIADTSVVSKEFNVASTHDGPFDWWQAQCGGAFDCSSKSSRQALDHKGRVLGQAQMHFEHFMKAEYYEHFMKAEFLANRKWVMNTLWNMQLQPSWLVTP